MLLLLYMDFFICLIKKVKERCSRIRNRHSRERRGLTIEFFLTKIRIWMADIRLRICTGSTSRILSSRLIVGVTSFLFLFSSIQLDMNVFSYSSPLKWPTVLFFFKTNREGNKSIKFFRTWNKKKMIFTADTGEKMKFCFGLCKQVNYHF